MNIVAWRRTRVAKLCAALFLVSVLIILYLRSGGNGASRSPVQMKLVARRLPWISDKIGNFEPPPELGREGPGEYGEPYRLPPEKEAKGEQSLGEYGMNMEVSDAISLERAIPDTREEECKYWNYPTNMGLKASVVIVFHNEGFSTLMRNVHTIIKRSPPEMLEEVVLVDDFSNKDNLKRKLDKYIERFDGLVKLFRNSQREGLIRARTIGAENSKGDVVVFLDAHCEVNKNWLPPLLAPIYYDHTTLTVPIIDGIDYQTFHYRPVYSPGTYFRGIFEWGMYYKETEIPKYMQKERKHKTEPYKSPTHAGGLFAIDRNYFLKLGAYDPGLLVWGGENFELSFKVWQCGGSIEWVPCSRVGHVYRGFMPYNFGKLAEKKKGSLIHINYKRVIEVWFDEKYKEFFYTREPLARYLDAGDISEQLALKEKLQCKSFDWFIKNVAPDLLDKYPELPPNLFWGEMRNQGSNTCFDTMGKPAPTKMGMSPCHGFGNNQLVRFNKKGQIGIGERCVEADENSVRLAFCPLGSVEGPWEYDGASETIQHKEINKCLAVHPTSGQPILRTCDFANSYHQWTFKKLKPRH